MTARLRKLFDDLKDTFWLWPGVLVLIGIALALILVRIDRSGVLPDWALQHWLYDGGASGASTLLGAVASSAIGVAGTVFSITIAALSLAAGQMGPRLLRNFTRDRRNQTTLGIFIATFAYALIVLRSVRSQQEGQFTPHLALTVAILLALVCLGTLVYFVGHMASRINVDTVVRLVSDDVRATAMRLATGTAQTEPPPPGVWRDAVAIPDARHGYLQHLDGDGLADWAAANGTRLRLLVRPGDYVFPGAPIALMIPVADGAAQAIVNATALGRMRDSPADLEFAVRQLVEVAVRALSPGINDPHTAMSVLDRLGSSLCELVPLALPSGVWERDGRAVLVMPRIDYRGLCDTMFHMIRQNGANAPAVLIRLLEVLTAVASAEPDEARRAVLQDHAGLVLQDAEREIANPSDLDDIRSFHADFITMRERGPAAMVARLSP